MRLRTRAFLFVTCLLMIALLVPVSIALASIDWCTGGCPPGLAKNGNERPYEATADNEHVDLHLVHPGLGNTVVTSKTPAADHNPNFTEYNQVP
ncbi:MAG TPA: hypothetical protein GX506_12285 [Firmicutes bacterium]|nr:hypothetical protein [Bacillota bacterium]